MAKEALSDIMTEKQLAEYLHVSVYTVRRMRLSEGLPVLKFDNMRAILYYRPAVEDWLRAKSVPQDGGDGDTAEEEKESGKGRRQKYGMAPIPD
ncbi:MAG: helix-turn-helix domain-containing protein [Acidaminococcaceae bacterium]|nr:helix-turn-helix domain-containing protein [Acidaminococcaceae bacterium]